MPFSSSYHNPNPTAAALLVVVVALFLLSIFSSFLLLLFAICFISLFRLVDVTGTYHFFILPSPSIAFFITTQCRLVLSHNVAITSIATIYRSFELEILYSLFFSIFCLAGLPILS